MALTRASKVKGRLDRTVYGRLGQESEIYKRT